MYMYVAKWPSTIKTMDLLHGNPSPCAPRQSNLDTLKGQVPTKLDGEVRTKGLECTGGLSIYTEIL